MLLKRINVNDVALKSTQLMLHIFSKLQFFGNKNNLKTTVTPLSDPWKPGNPKLGQLG